MKKITTVILFLFIGTTYMIAHVADSVYLFSYVNPHNNGKNGLNLAWSSDQSSWQIIGNGYSFLKSDFGTWGAEKRMLTPYLLQDETGKWHCLFSMNEKVNAFADATSDDLFHWLPQDYHYVAEGSCLNPSVTYNAQQRKYTIYYQNNSGNFAVETADFKSFGTPRATNALKSDNPRVTMELPIGKVEGQLFKVSKGFVEYLRNCVDAALYRNSLNSETMASNAERFSRLKPLEATLTIQPEKAKSISNTLIGIFFEDINYSADGGLYAELIQNRDFEYNNKDRGEWNAKTAWELTGDAVWEIKEESPIHPNNAHYSVITTQKPGASLTNIGFDGINIRKGEKYDFSIFTKQLDGKGSLLIKLVNPANEIIAQAKIRCNKNWQKQSVVLNAKKSCDNARLVLTPQKKGSLAIDMVSLFPQNTFKNRKNGMRADLAQTLADLHPKFVRFPGGCVAHGNGLDNIYRWKNTIGKLESRKTTFNLWGYHQTMGLGYYEYFQFCEDIGAEPLPVLAAGVPCQNSSRGGYGQQDGIPMEEMDEYIQDILDLIEWANGSVNSTWGKKRAEAGHPEPFNLKYIGIGNEDLITKVFEERFEMIYKAIQKKYPEITVIGTVGPFYEGADYEEGWDFATRLGVPMVDEHYYVAPGWMVNHQNYYDQYNRKGPKVYLGEYAAHLPGRPNNVETALTEALYLASVERNADVVAMTSYAPLLAKEKHTQWNPDLIYFTNTEVKPTVGYYTQQMYGQNSGDFYLPSVLKLRNNDAQVNKQVAVSVVRDSKTNDLIVKMVNLLPVTVSTKLELPEEYSQITKTLLTGKPEDKKAHSTTEAVTLEDNTYVMPAYSFTVLRMKK